MMSKNIFKIILMLIAVSGVACNALAAESPNAQAEEKKQIAIPIRDGFVLFALEAEITRSEDGKYFISFANEIKDFRGVIKSGQKVLLLKNSTLENVAKIMKDKTSLSCKAWGRITQFEKTNYIYLSYYLPMGEVEEEAEQVKTDEEVKKSGEEKTESEKEPESILPADVLKKLKPKKFVDVKQLKASSLKLEDVIVADRFAYICQTKDGRAYMQLDGLGQKVGDVSFELLNCAALQQALKVMGKSAMPIRFKISGIASQYEGETVLLLQRAAKVFSNGNFPR